MSAPAFATTYTVTSGGDTPGCPGACTFREVASLVNGSTGPHVINVTVSPVVLAISGVDDTNTAGDIDFSESVTVQPGGLLSHVTITCDGTGDRCLDTHGSATLTLNHVTVSGGATASDGGCIRTVGALDLNDSAVTDCSAGGDGGAVWVGGQFRSQDGVTLQQSEADGDGGGAYVADDWESEDIDVRDNTAGGSGGGVYIVDTFSVGGAAEFARNDAADYGGGLYAWDEVTISVGSGHTDLLVDSNTATYGGGFYLVGESNTVGYAGSGYDSTFVDNEAQYGAGAFVVGDDLWMANVLLDGNLADVEGGGLYVLSSSVDLYDVSFESNQTLGGGDDGGGLYLDGNTDVTVHGGLFLDNVADRDGGAVFSDFIVALVFDDVGFEGNAAEDGGALYVDSLTLDVDGASFVENTASGKGGAIYVHYCDVYGSADCTIASATFEGNTATTDGQAIYAFGSGHGSLNLEFVTMKDESKATSGFPIYARASAFDAYGYGFTDVSDNVTTKSGVGSVGSYVGSLDLGSLGACGGSSPYTVCRNPLYYSALVNAVSSGCSGVAQNGTARTSSPCEAGAVEL